MKIIDNDNYKYFGGFRVKGSYPCTSILGF